MEIEKAVKPRTMPAAVTFPEADHTLRKIIVVAAIAAGVQFGWALQLSLLTPYAQMLGVPHILAAFIWSYGPMSDVMVQPLVGYYSDRCTSKFGKRRPFIAVGAAMATVSMFLIAFAADVGHRFGDSYDEPFKTRALAVFVLGFWFLGIANTMLQGPCRAFLADLSAGSQRKTRMANSMFSFFTALGNILGFAAGSYTHLYQLFPFTKTRACDSYCANLKSCFFISVALLLTLATIVFLTVPEKPVSRPDNDSDVSEVEDNGTGGENNNGELQRSSIPFLGEMYGALSNLRRPMWVLLLVTCLNWIAWFPFLIFGTDWMGREVYGGQVGEDRMYIVGVRAGSFGLMLNSVVLGVTSLWLEFPSSDAGGMKRLWGIVNFILAACLAMTVVITKLAESNRQFLLGGGDPLPPPYGIKIGSLLIFAALGIPLAVTNSIPFAFASIFSNSSGAGQGFSLGIVNLAIIVPQMLISVTSGPWDVIFGGGNLPVFVVGAIAATISGILALTMLPSLPAERASAVVNSMPSLPPEMASAVVNSVVSLPPEMAATVIHSVPSG